MRVLKSRECPPSLRRSADARLRHCSARTSKEAATPSQPPPPPPPQSRVAPLVIRCTPLYARQSRAKRTRAIRCHIPPRRRARPAMNDHISNDTVASLVIAAFFDAENMLSRRTLPMLFTRAMSPPARGLLIRCSLFFTSPHHLCATRDVYASCPNPLCRHCPPFLRSIIASAMFIPPDVRSSAPLSRRDFRVRP